MSLETTSETMLLPYVYICVFAVFEPINGTIPEGCEYVLYFKRFLLRAGMIASITLF